MALLLRHSRTDCYHSRGPLCVANGTRTDRTAPHHTIPHRAAQPNQTKPNQSQTVSGNAVICNITRRRCGRNAATPQRRNAAPATNDVVSDVTESVNVHRATLLLHRAEPVITEVEVVKTERQRTTNDNNNTTKQRTTDDDERTNDERASERTNERTNDADENSAQQQLRPRGSGFGSSVGSVVMVAVTSFCSSVWVSLWDRRYQSVALRLFRWFCSSQRAVQSVGRVVWSLRELMHWVGNAMRGSKGTWCVTRTNNEADG